MHYSPSPFENRIKKAAHSSNKAAFIEPFQTVHYSQKSKPLPPYGKNLFDNLQKGIKPKNSIFLFLGLTAWKSAKAFSKNQTVLILPLNTSPYDYYWPVQGCSVLAFDKGGLEPCYIEQTAHALLLAGASSVHVNLFNYQLVIYKGA